MGSETMRRQAVSKKTLDTWKFRIERGKGRHPWLHTSYNYAIEIKTWISTSL